MASTQPVYGNELNEVPIESREENIVEASGDDQTPKGSRRKKGANLYCLCRKPSGKRFMIRCDGCEEWYHGDCVKISKNTSRIIDKYFCPSCTAKNPNLKIIYKVKKEKMAPTPSIPVRCTECINCVKEPDCGECARCTAKNGRCLKVICLTEKKEEADRRRSQRIAEKEVEDSEYNEESATPSPVATPRRAGGGGVAVAGKEGVAGKKGKKGTSRKNKSGKECMKKGRNDSESDDDALAKWNYASEMERQKNGPQPQSMQCLGPKCVRAARPNSKYCSNKCGMKLAKTRIEAHLPKSAQSHFNVETVAVRQAGEAAERRAQERVGLDQMKVYLDNWHDLVMRYVNAVKVFPPSEKASTKDNSDFMVSCPVCAAEYGNKVIKKHMERCYAKKEKENTFGGKHKCIINPLNIFCDEFNPSDSSYCKRLRVTCPEHYKGDIEAGLQVCGWPKVWNREGSLTMDQLFTSVEDIIADNFCGIPRRECKQHIGWITTTLGIIDTHRVAYYTRIEEMLDEAIKEGKTPDALLLMSNHTEHHQPLEQIVATYDEAAATNGREAVQPIVL